MDKKKTVFFFLFSLLYCFVLIDRSFFNLNDDNLNIGTVIAHLTHAENFNNDFVKITKGIYYLPCFITPLLFIQKMTDNYIMTLQILLFFQLFFTFLTTSYMARVLFGNMSTLKNILITFLLTMVLVYLPYGEMVGFGTLCSALARYSYSIFTPLLIALYYKYEYVPVMRWKIPSILIIGAFSGILINLHPPSAVTAYFMFFFHWLFFRSGILKKNNFKQALLKALLSAFAFFFFSLIYVIPYVHHYYFSQNSVVPIIQQPVSPAINVPAPSAPAANTVSDASQALQNIAKFSIKFKFSNDILIYSLRQLFFLPFLLPFLFLVFLFRANPPVKYPEPDLFNFLKSLFISSFVICICGNFISEYVSFGPYLHVFHRADRFLFLVFELLAVYALVYSGCFIREKALRYASCAGLIFFWVSLSRIKGLFQYDLLSKIVPLKIDLEIQTLIVNSFIAIILLSGIILFRSGRLEKNLSAKVILVPLTAVMFLWPVVSGGAFVAISHFINSLNGIGSWAFIGKLTSARTADRINDFDKTCAWIRINTDNKARFLFFDNKAHAIKICSLRSGLGIIDEIGNILGSEVNKLYDLADPEERAKEILRLTEKYRLDYVLINEEYKIVPAELTGFEPVFESRFHKIFKRRGSL